MTLTDIAADVNSAKMYYLQELSATLTQMKAGCGSVKPLLPLKRLIQSLNWQIQDNINDDTTTALYVCLKSIIGDFTMPYPYDPSVVIPGQTVVVINPAPYIPPTEIYFNMLTANGTRYDNVAWAGVNPYLFLDNTTWLQRDVDYTLLPSGGFILNNQIYEGQTLRAVTYELA